MRKLGKARQFVNAKMIGAVL